MDIIAIKRFFYYLYTTVESLVITLFDKVVSVTLNCVLPLYTSKAEGIFIAPIITSNISIKYTLTIFFGGR